ncbi:MAG: hypothetical protein RIF41_25995 [Polyangiaceae bacterium]
MDAVAYQDTMTIVGGSIGVASGLTGTILGIAAESEDKDALRTGAYTSAGFAAAGGVLALLAGLTDDPAVAIEKFHAAERHFGAANDVALVTPFNQLQPGQREYNYAVHHYRECTKAKPKEKIEPLK